MQTVLCSSQNVIFLNSTGTWGNFKCLKIIYILYLIYYVVCTMYLCTWISVLGLLLSTHRHFCIPLH